MEPQYALVVEDDETTARAFERVACSMGYQVDIANTISEARSSLLSRRPELMLIDVGLPDGSGLAVLEEFQHQRPDKVIVVTGDSTTHTAIECVRLHATDLLNKPFNIEDLKDAILRDAANAPTDALARQRRWPARKKSVAFDITIGETLVSEKLHSAAGLIAATDYASAIIEGDSGVDKLGVAQWIHHNSNRQGELIYVNCAVERGQGGNRQFFGEEDAQTGELIQRGYVEQASGGTLLLDNALSLPPDIQSRLAHVLDFGSLVRHNGLQPVRVKLSMLGVHRDDLETGDKAQHALSEFDYRLGQFRLKVPSVLQRGDDVILLAQAVLDELNRDASCQKILGEQAMNALVERTWPGNLRELKHALIKAFEEQQADSGEIVLGSSADIPMTQTADDLVQSYVGSSVWKLQKDLLLATLAYTKGDKTRAAAMLGVSLKTLYNRLGALG